MNIKIIYILFWLYAILGWGMETLWVSFQNKKFINRGFFIGPYCPIYGTGGVLLLSLNNYQNDPIVIFFLAVIICSIVEYLASYILELIYKVRWWDYTNRFGNINGRICLFNSICFGLLGILVVCFLNPFFIDKISLIPNIYLNILIIILFLITFTDIIATFTMMSDIRNLIINLKERTLTNIFKPNSDSTEEVSKRIRNMLKEKSFIHKHLSKSYANLKVYKNNFFKKSEELLKYRKKEKIENTFIIGSFISLIIGYILGKVYDNKFLIILCFTINILIIYLINRGNHER